MVDLKSKNRFDKDTILCDLIKILKNMPSDWERGFSDTIGAETRLVGDFALESIQIVQLVIAIEKHFQRQGLPFQELFMSNNRNIDDLRVSDLAEFLYAHLNTP